MLSLLFGLTLAQAEPSEHTLLYYNARMALREAQPLESVKLWLLRNAYLEQTGKLSTQDADFHSVTWAALGRMGICQDGLREDTDGAGLWPVALHNWVVRNRSKRRVKPGNPYDAFEVGRQGREVSINDVLGSQELKTVTLTRGRCVRPKLTLMAIGELPTAKLSDRKVAVSLMLYLLRRSRDTLNSGQVHGQAAIEARLFDLNLQLISIVAREARIKARNAGRKGLRLGLSRRSVKEMTDDAPKVSFPDDSEPARILRLAVDWSADEWMSLSADRRLFLFEQVRSFGGDEAKLEEAALGIIDALILRKEGEEVAKWIGLRSEDLSQQRSVWGGVRGQQLLTLDDESGFRERGVIALHQGVFSLESGDLPSALRSFAYALNAAPQSAFSEEVASLSLRWLSYVSSQFEVSDELLITLQQLVPRREYSVLLEDLMWGAALRADEPSFRRGLRNQLGRGALERRVALLTPLAAGNLSSFSKKIGAGLESSPSETLRFLRQFVARLELEDAGVRTAHLPTVAAIRGQLEHIVLKEGGRQGRQAEEIIGRTQAITEGLGGLGPLASDLERARSADPRSEVFAGSVRLAPSDQLPWPFRAVQVSAPSVFEPLSLTPSQWSDTEHDVVLGWSIGG